MTKIRSPVYRETYGQVFERGMRPVIVGLKPPNLIELRLKGTRRRYYLTAEAAWNIALRGHLRLVEKEKAAARKARRAARRQRVA